MAFTLVPTTLIGAVNELLTAIGSVPVNTLDAPGSSDVAIAKDTVESISREVQTRGWWFNTSYNVSLAPSSNEIAVPTEYLSVRPSSGTTVTSPETKQFVLRNQKLWNVAQSSYTFTTSVQADIIALLDFEELPESARRYVTIRAARLFQTKVLGDDQLAVFNEAHEQEAWQLIEEDDATSNPVSTMYMARVRRMGRLMNADPVTPNTEPRRRSRRQ